MFLRHFDDKYFLHPAEGKGIIFLYDKDNKDMDGGKNMFVNEYTLKRLYEALNEELEKKVVENLMRENKSELFEKKQSIAFKNL